MHGIWPIRAKVICGKYITPTVNFNSKVTEKVVLAKH